MYLDDIFTVSYSFIITKRDDITIIIVDDQASRQLLEQTRQDNQTNKYIIGKLVCILDVVRTLMAILYIYMSESRLLLPARSSC